MNIRKYVVGAVITFGLAWSCSSDESLYPLPYDSRATGSYLRVYKIQSNVWDFDQLGLGTNGFTAVYESVDKSFGSELALIEFFATHRSGGSGLITDEVLVKTIDAAGIAAAFSAVPEPTYSDYLRSTPITVTEAETMAALNTLVGVDPDGVNGVDLPQCTGIFPKTCPAVAFPGALVQNDQIIFRVAITDTQGRKFTVANRQTTISPSLGNPNEANITANLTGGIFYNSPMTYVVTVVRTNNFVTANSYGFTTAQNYRMTQVARWQPDHSAAQHQSFPQAWIDQFLFGSSATDSTQTVSLSAVTNGLPTERQFTCTYRGQTINMVINLENAPTGLSAAAIATLNTAKNTPGQPAATAFGLGMNLMAPANSLANLGTVFVPLANTTVDCVANTREFYQVTPLAGTFAGTAALPWGLPRATVPNRGVYRIDKDGTVAGTDAFIIVVDDDADEYGRRNGYCNWFTRVILLMERIP